MRHRRVTIADVADAAGVSIATVSKVLNGRYGVAAGTAERVQRVIDDLGYTASLGAASLRNRSTHVIAVLVTEIEPFSAELLKGISHAMQESDYELLIYVGGRHRSTPGWEQKYVSRLGGTLADGTILVTPASGTVDSAAPVVAVDPHTGSGAASVVSDNFAGAVAATEHLLALGHRRIGFLGGREGLESARLREAGFRAAMRAAGVAVEPHLVVAGDYRAESTVQPAHSLLDGLDRPTAVFAANDQSAIELMHVATELGLRVPDDVSVIGFDNIPESALTDPPLSTVSQPIHEMGEAAFAMLVGLLDGTAEPTRLVLPTELVPRASTGPAPA